MSIDNLHPLFNLIPENVKQEKLDLIDHVNKRHLHCEKGWGKVLEKITGAIALNYFLTAKPSKESLVPKFYSENISPSQLPKTYSENISHSQLPKTNVEHVSLLHILMYFITQFKSVYFDANFEEKIVSAAQTHIITALINDEKLAKLLIHWIICNAVFIPLGKKLLPAFEKDMEKKSLFYKHIMSPIIDIDSMAKEELEKGKKAMSNFLGAVEKANKSTLPKFQKVEGTNKTVAILSVKNGAGGHTAPHRAMAARLQERGYHVETIHYDTDLSNNDDPFRVLNITFEDGSPMTENSFEHQWKMQKQHLDESEIISFYISAKQTLGKIPPDNKGKELLNKIASINPHAIVTTMAYHWSWKSLAYRTGIKTILAASDIFIHSNALGPWYRQHNIEKPSRAMHFTAMTSDLNLLKSLGKAHDDYIQSKHPLCPIPRLFTDQYKGLFLDDQITVIGAPIDPSFKAITAPKEIAELRSKWKVEEGEVVVCISRGKLGVEEDLTGALEVYQTKKELSRPLKLFVVCGENKTFYEKLLKGKFKGLGPNITIVPFLLLEPKDFAEIRAISVLDDIKAGGASAFEGWYLISQGARFKLVLTQGAGLFWEKCNGLAMEQWGVGRMISEKLSKIEILEQTLKEGIQPIKNSFPDWKKPFDDLISKVIPQ